MGIPTITLRELDGLRRAGKAVEVIDVRTPAEHGEVHAEGTRNIPLDRLDPEALLGSRESDAADPLDFICRSGSRAREACEDLAASGFGNAVNVEGGTEARERAGLPVVRGRKAISLERQVRIAAGTLVLLGTTPGALVRPFFLGLPTFVGAGLVFAGVTNSCGMAMALGRMPWNRAGVEGTTCSS